MSNRLLINDSSYEYMNKTIAIEPQTCDRRFVFLVPEWVFKSCSSEVSPSCGGWETAFIDVENHTVVDQFSLGQAAIMLKYSLNWLSSMKPVDGFFGRSKTPIGSVKSVALRSRKWTICLIVNNASYVYELNECARVCTRIR